MVEIQEDGESKKNRIKFRVTVFAILPAALLLSACSSLSSSGPTTTSPSTRTAYLRQVIPRVGRLVATRHALSDQFIFTFPTVVTITNVSSTQAVATAACALPDAPKGAQACPAEFAVSYHLVFAVRGEKGMGSESIDVNHIGCQSVTGLGAVREVISYPTFYRLLGNAMGLKNANSMTFRGVFRTGG